MPRDVELQLNLYGEKCDFQMVPNEQITLRGVSLNSKRVLEDDMPRGAEVLQTHSPQRLWFK